MQTFMLYQAHLVRIDNMSIKTFWISISGYSIDGDKLQSNESISQIKRRTLNQTGHLKHYGKCRICQDSYYWKSSYAIPIAKIGPYCTQCATTAGLKIKLGAVTSIISQYATIPGIPMAFIAKIFIQSLLGLLIDYLRPTIDNLLGICNDTQLCIGKE